VAGTYTQRALPGSEPSQDSCTFRPGLRSCRVILVAAIGWCGLAAEQGDCFGDVGVVPGGQVLRGEREVVVGRDADAVNELVVGA
jgi:hypothetical protein